MEHEEIVETNVIRLDPRDLNSIIQAVKADAPSSSQQTSAAYSLKREGFGRQYEFNSSLVRKLSNVHGTEDIETVIPEVIQELNVRNETLKIADSHPQVFQNYFVATYCAELDRQEKYESNGTTSGGGTTTRVAIITIMAQDK
ncbi:unnamed protein product [Heligmosomoides polygyrus]|uniref:TF_AP-2 domain-containing protein n=1 Tax=Heligmosomoides polygyrus TaxID=6339 RepID=A0A3P8A0D8_HELPZ|nr:unnamed protein product [Heligmosomoides polygyrus]